MQFPRQRFRIKCSHLARLLVEEMMERKRCTKRIAIYQECLQQVQRIKSLIDTFIPGLQSKLGTTASSRERQLVEICSPVSFDRPTNCIGILSRKIFNLWQWRNKGTGNFLPMTAAINNHNKNKSKQQSNTQEYTHNNCSSIARLDCWRRIPRCRSHISP